MDLLSHLSVMVVGVFKSVSAISVPEIPIVVKDFSIISFNPKSSKRPSEPPVILIVLVSTSLLLKVSLLSVIAIVATSASVFFASVGEDNATFSMPLVMAAASSVGV